MCAGSTTCSLANKDFVKCDRDIKLKNYKLVVSWECTLSCEFEATSNHCAAWTIYINIYIMYT